MIPPERNNLGSLADVAIRTETVLVREGIVVASRGAKELRRDDDVHGNARVVWREKPKRTAFTPRRNTLLPPLHHGVRGLDWGRRRCPSKTRIKR
jgi:hypothetical protein